VFQQFHQVDHPHAVIDRLGADAWPHLLKARGKGRPVARLDLAGVIRAHIDAQLLEFQARLALFCGRQVDRLGTDHPRDVFPAHQHRFARQLALIDPADQRELEQPAFVILDQHEADLVHVRIHHHAHPVFAFAVFCRQNVAQRVHPHLIRQRSHRFQNDLAHFVFIARHRHGIAQLFK